MTNTATTTTKRPARKAAPKSEAARIALAEKAMDRPVRKPRKAKDSDLVFVPGVGTVLPKPGVTVHLHPVKSAKKAPAAKQAPAKKAPAKKVTKATEAKTAIERITELRAEGVAWRPLSATLNAEGFTTVRGKSFSANGTTAFLLGGKHGVK
jgi:hypothetical protein